MIKILITLSVMIMLVTVTSASIDAKTLNAQITDKGLQLDRRGYQPLFAITGCQKDYARIER